MTTENTMALSIIQIFGPKEQVAMAQMKITDLSNQLMSEEEEIKIITTTLSTPVVSKES